MSSVPLPSFLFMESILVSFCSVVSWNLSSGSCLCWNVCVSMCISAWECVFPVGHPMGTKRAVCAPSGAEMYTSDNRRLQSSIGAALLIVPHAQWAFLSPSVFLSVSFSLYNHIQTVLLMRDWRNRILIGCLDPDVSVTTRLYVVVSHCVTISRDFRIHLKPVFLQLCEISRA